MIYVEYAKQRYDAAILEIERLKQSEFPYTHIQDCLLQLGEFFRAQRSQLNKLTDKSTPEVAKNACSQSLAYLFIYTPFLGFILRSTNVRNAFELYAPLMRLARQLLGDSTRLLLSSEWDYSPFVYLPTDELPHSVLIGVPAFESSNPLLVALAGHELGHNVWSQCDLGHSFDGTLRSEVLSAVKGKYWDDFQECFPHATHDTLTTDMFMQQAWLPAHTFAARQLEEVFCDMMGLRLFAEAYLHAFAYLLSPGTAGQRAPFYPSITTRVAYLEQGSSAYDVEMPLAYADLFESQEARLDPVTQVLVDIADEAIKSLVGQVISKAKDLSDEKSVPMRSRENVEAISRDMRRVMPADGSATLTDLVNAGWSLLHDPTLWSDVPQIRVEDRHWVLHDLVLKSCEVAEYSERTRRT